MYVYNSLYNTWNSLCWYIYIKNIRTNGSKKKQAKPWLTNDG